MEEKDLFPELNAAQSHLETRSKELTHKVDTIDKRLDDFKWSMTLFSSAVTVAAFIFSLLLAFNHYSDRQGLLELSKDMRKDFETLKSDSKEEIKEKLGKTARKPELRVNYTRDCGLQDQEVECPVERNIKAVGDSPKDNVPASTNEVPGGYWIIHCPIIVQNIGKANSDKMFIKIYTSDPVKTDKPSTDESAYGYEAYYWSLTPNQLPPGMSVKYKLNITKGNFDPSVDLTKVTKCNALLKVSYGEDLVLRVPFIMVLKLEVSKSKMKTADTLPAVP